jgi:hypothetical protein
MLDVPLLPSEANSSFEYWIEETTAKFKQPYAYVE